MPIRYTLDINPPMSPLYYAGNIHAELNAILNAAEFGHTSAQIDGVSRDGGMNVNHVAIIVRDLAELSNQQIKLFEERANKIDPPFMFKHDPTKVKNVARMRDFVN